MRHIIKEEQAIYRLNKKGADALKTSELIAIILGGSNNKSTQKTAEELLTKFEGNLTRLARATSRELGIEGIGPVKASQIIAAIQLGIRISSYCEEDRPIVNTPSDVAKLLMSEMRFYKCEVFKTVLLDTKNRVIKIQTISSGILDASLVHAREVFFHAIQELASSIILVHNHPSGNTIPSSQDIQITKNIMEAGQILGIEVIDHIIIGDGKFLSLKEKKII
jgi:DNA repair protein RadC